MKNITNNYGRKNFYIGYAIFCALLAFSLSIGIGLFYDFIREYESSRPDHVIENYVSVIDGETFSSIAAEAISRYSSGFETEESSLSALKAAAKGGITFTKHIGSDGNDYDVYCGGKLMRVTLSPDYEGKYGFTHYKVTNTEIYPEWIEERSSPISVIVPDGSSVSVNGKSVGNEYMKPEKLESASLSIFEQRDFALVEYDLGYVFGSVTVDGEYRGETLTISRLEDGAYCSDYDLPSRADYTVSAPSGADVTINGVKVTSDYLSRTDKADELQTEFESGKTPMISVYKIELMLGTPEVEVRFDGSSLSPVSSDSTHSDYGYPASYMKSYSVSVPHGMTLYCNGIEVGKKYETEANILYDAPPFAPGINITERCDTYTVELCHSPSFTVSDANVALKSDGSAFTFYPVPTSSESDAVSSAATAFTRLFITFSFRGSDNPSGNFDACMEHVLKNSAAYRLLRSTYDAMAYNSPYKITTLEINVRELSKYSDDCIAVTIDFESHGKRYKYEKDNNGTYNMIWQKLDGEWKLSYLTI